MKKDDKSIKAPLVDAVDVVRCKDCKFWTDSISEGLTIKNPWGYCSKLTERYREDCESSFDNQTRTVDYCSYGERRGRRIMTNEEAIFQAERKQRVRTNADHIRSLSDEELAEILFEYKECSKKCLMNNGKNCYQICENKSVILEWLRQPAEGERHED